MRILITGYTTRMFGSTRVQGDYMTFSYLLEDILKKMGHEVQRRNVLIGEELWKNYDFAFCGVAPLSSMTSGRICETHYAMDMMRGRHAVYADDWSFCSFGDSVRYTVERWGTYLKYKKFPYSQDITEGARKSLENMMSWDESGNAPVLAPMFPWGNHMFLMRGTKPSGNYKANLITVDPSRFLRYPTVTIQEPLDRTRHWVMAALSDHTSWVRKQGFKLPVKFIGNKRMENSVVLSEAATVQLFAESFGILSVGYPSAGSGWWRTRYMNSAWAESIIYSDPRDAAIMGVPFRGTPEYFEGISSEHEYRVLAQAQNDWMYNNISSKDTVMLVLERLMKK